MCGSSEILKKDGFYVCESCGTKFSPEEARKLLMDISGSTINVANNPQEKNLEKLAIDAYEAKNWKEAESFANQVLAINENNFEAWEVKAVAASRQGDILTSRVNEALLALPNAYKCKNEDEKKQYTEHLYGHFIRLILPEYKERVRIFQNCCNGKDVLIVFLKTVQEQGLKTLTGIGFDEENALNKYYSLLNEIILIGYQAMKPTWESGAIKYYKNDFSSLGSKWTRNRVNIGGDVCYDDNERPDKFDFDLYLSVIDDIIAFGELLIEIVNPDTDAHLILSVLKEMIRINELALNAVSFKTFWPILGSTKRWMIEYELSEMSKSERKEKINEWRANILQVESVLKG